MNYYNWSKGNFSKTFDIISNNKHLGRLVGNSFSNSAELMIDGKKYLYRTNGFSRQKTSILNLSDSKLAGEVLFNVWMTKAEIRLNNERYFLKFDNLMNTRWTISNSEGSIINYQGNSSGKGSIVSNADDNLLVATGLFVANHYWQAIVAVSIAAFLPIWVILLSQ